MLIYSYTSFISFFIVVKIYFPAYEMDFFFLFLEIDALEAHFAYDPFGNPAV